uniref:Uncharacterized protein n=1 Tax=Arundo donax TaxID=35708 RepID=A0A0A9EU82_ARUDO
MYPLNSTRSEATRQQMLQPSQRQNPQRGHLGTSCNRMDFCSQQDMQQELVDHYGKMAV